MRRPAPPERHQDPSLSGVRNPGARPLVASYYPLDIAEGTAITERRRIPGGTPTLLASLGHPPRLSVERVSARVATQEQYRLLRLPGDLPVLRPLRVVFSDDDRPIEATVMVKAGHLYEVQYEITPETG